MSDPIVFRCKKCGHSFERHERGFCKHCTCTKYTGPVPTPAERPTQPPPAKAAPVYEPDQWCDLHSCPMMCGFCYACAIGAD